MSFWNSQKLEARVNGEKLVLPYRPESIDCNAYELRIGAEIYVTPTTGSANTHTKRKLVDGEGFTIPAGQFALLMSEESVNVPLNAMAFISIKTKIKLRGLINASGFHVDPGWNGPLVFSVFNAGPSTVHLQRGQRMFLLWFSDLNENSEKHKTLPGPTELPPELINNITGELNSFENLAKQLRELKEDLDTRTHKIEVFQTRVVVMTWILTLLIVGTFGWAIRANITDFFSIHVPAQHVEKK